MRDNRVMIPLKDLFELFVMQNDLDTSIIKQHNLQLSYQELIDMRKLAFVVELGEFANETRVFKYWSVKEPSERKVILEEYVDGLHFILSLGILKGYGEKRLPDISFVHDSLVDYKVNKHQVIVQMLDVIYYAITLEFTTLLKSYVQLGYMWGFSWEEIVQAYKDKNNKNHKRQETGTY